MRADGSAASLSDVICSETVETHVLCLEAFREGFDQRTWVEGGEGWGWWISGVHADQ